MKLLTAESQICLIRPHSYNIIWHFVKTCSQVHLYITCLKMSC